MKSSNEVKRHVSNLQITGSEAPAIRLSCFDPFSMTCISRSQIHDMKERELSVRCDVFPVKLRDSAAKCPASQKMPNASI